MKNKLAKFLTPEKLYSFNTGMVVLNLICVTATMALGLPAAYTHLFLASGLCFIVGALANYAIIRLRNHSRK